MTHSWVFTPQAGALGVMIKSSAGFCLLWEHQNAHHSPSTVGNTQDEAAEQSHHAGAQDLLMPSGQISEKKRESTLCLDLT